MPALETKLFQAVKARVNALPMKVTYPIVWSTDASYTPDANKGYLRCTWIPNQTQRLLVGSSAPHRRPGLLQIDVMGRKTLGEDVAIEIAGQVAENFPPDLPLPFQGIELRVTKAPSVLATVVGTHIQVPVLIALEALE